MYIQITTRCNMLCGHCCFACTEKGEDMTPEVWVEALKIADDTVTIGGGEPTIHPNFWHFLCDAIGKAGSGNVWLATNGKITETALTLANMAKRGIIGCDLSQDRWHEEIDTAVIDAFTKQPEDEVPL